MKVLFDHQTFSLQDYGGISKYHTELQQQLNRIPSIECDLSLKYSNNVYVKKIMPGITTVFPTIEVPYKRHLIEYFNRSNSIWRINEGDFDLFHPTYYKPYFLNAIGKKPFVVTVHDMMHELFPQDLSQHIAAVKKLLIERATRIIAVSENTKNDLLRIYPASRGKVDVVHHGIAVDQKGTNKSSGSTLLPDEYILFVGDRSYYKNFSFFIKAMSLLLKQKRSLYVVCAGSRPFSNKECREINSYKLANRIIHTRITANNLSEIYKKAMAFVFPSLYEGFGIPVLEAFANDCPAILSNRSSLPEIGGDAAVYFDPDDLDSAFSTIRNVVEKKELRNKLAQMGLQRVKSFSWENTAKKTVETYEKALLVR